MKITFGKVLVIALVAMVFAGAWFGSNAIMENYTTTPIWQELDVEELLNVYIDYEYGKGYYGVLYQYDEGDRWLHFDVYDVDQVRHHIGVVSVYYAREIAELTYRG